MEQRERENGPWAAHRYAVKEGTQTERTEGGSPMTHEDGGIPMARGVEEPALGMERTETSLPSLQVKVTLLNMLTTL